jgi:hypothetical protein
MALPGRDKTFALGSCRDMLEKLCREIERFKKAETPSDRIDFAFNAVVTAWHLCDWVFNDMTTEQRRALAIDRIEDMTAHARSSRALHLCRQAATASKHWKVTQHRDDNAAVIVTATPIKNVQHKFVPTENYLSVVSGWHLYFIDGDITRAAEDVFEEALTFWTTFIYQNQVVPGEGVAPDEEV